MFGSGDNLAYLAKSEHPELMSGAPAIDHDGTRSFQSTVMYFAKSAVQQRAETMHYPVFNELLEKMGDAECVVYQPSTAQFGALNTEGAFILLPDGDSETVMLGVDAAGNPAD